MPRSKSHIPEGLRTVMPQVVVKDAAPLIRFLREVFNAEITNQMPNPDGKGVMHATARVGDATLFLSDSGSFAKPTAANTFVYVTDADATMKKAQAAGARVISPVTDVFWGDRWGMVEDPTGNVWQIATHTEDLTPEEIQKRAKSQPPRKQL